MRHQTYSPVLIAALVASVGVGCGEGRQPATEAPAEPPSVQTDPVAERGFIRLTGCVKPDATPGRYVLTGVASAGLLTPSERDEQERSWTAGDGATTEADVAARASSTYQLIPGDDEDLGAYEDKRVTVRGRLAAERPQGTAGRTDEPAEPGSAGTRTRAGQRSAEVIADAPPARGFYVESIDEVAETCQ